MEDTSVGPEYSVSCKVLIDSEIGTGRERESEAETYLLPEQTSEHYCRGNSIP